MTTQERLEAAAATVHELFTAEKEFNAPIFQRLFVWGADELERLWADIDQVVDGEDSSRFLGAIVLQDRSSKLAFAPRTYWIIDGQQRLTTLYLLLTAVSELATKAKLSEFAEQVAKGYLLNQQGAHAGEAKIRPTNRDLAQFAAVVKVLEPYGTKPIVGFGEVSGAITSMYSRVRRGLQERVRLYGTGYLETVASNVLEKLKFVQIILSSDEDPHQVFDSLNNAGQKLETIDLVRNEVFQKFDDDYAAAENLYNAGWRAFEDSLGDSLGGFFFPFALVKKPSATKSRTFSVLKEQWSELTPPAVLDDLLDFVPAFKAVALGEPLEVSAELRLAIDRLVRMPAPAVVYPFTMRLIRNAVRGELSHEAAAANLRLTEAFLVRRAFAGFEPTGLHAVFKSIWADTRGDPGKFIATIDKNPTIEFPNDDKFVGDIANRQLYFRKLARYILWEYERGLLGGDPVPTGVDMTIDHVAPQSPTDEWASAFPAAEHELLVHTWANLVPLSNPLNAQKSRKNWQETRELFRTETIFKSTKRLAERYEAWTPAELMSRSQELAAWALKRWPKKP